jgi:alanine racemase
MEVKRGRNGCTLIEDYYNSDPASLGMALDFLRRHARGKTTLILSDFRQIGGDEKLLYEGVARAVRSAGIDRFIGIGEALSRQSDGFPQGHCSASPRRNVQKPSGEYHSGTKQFSSRAPVSST